MGCVYYAADHEGKQPHLIRSKTDCGHNIEHSGVIEKWGLLYPGYVKELKVFWCPSRRNGQPCSMDPKPSSDNGISSFGVGVGSAWTESSYGHYSGTESAPIRMSSITNLSKKVLGVDVFNCDNNIPRGASVCHGGGYHNVVYFDGHAAPFVDTNKYLETLDTGAGHGERLVTGFNYIEEHDSE